METKASAFISYSRKNKEFVQRLHTELTEQGRDVWCDWEDIPGGVDWWMEIEKGIEKSDNIIFVISPQSCGSANCQAELCYAIAQHKRIIPVVYQAIDQATDSVPPELARLNWIFLDDFPEVLPEAMMCLEHVLDFDLEDTRQHTHLLSLADIWHKSAKDNSYLLRGTQLVKAEEWLSGTTDHPPFPTHLQREFILKSQKFRAATTFVRLLLIGGILLVLAFRQC